MGLFSVNEMKKANYILENLEKNENATKPVKIKIFDDSNAKIKNIDIFVNELAKLSGLIEVEVVQPQKHFIGAGISLNNIHYHTIPINIEFEPFLITISRVSRKNSELKPEISEKLREIRNKIEIIVFIAPICPYCAAVVETVNQFAIENELIDVHIVDTSYFPNLEKEFDITSAPTVLINRIVKLISPTTKELFEWVQNASVKGEGNDIETEFFSKMLKDGQIDELEKIIRKNPEKSILLPNLLKRDEINVRLGASILISRISFSNEILDELKKALYKMLKTNNPNNVQDAAFVLGNIGDNSDLPVLESILKNSNKDIKEAGKEAIDEIKRRNVLN